MTRTPLDMLTADVRGGDDTRPPTRRFALTRLPPRAIF
jgi:hypothetical protein